MSRTSSIRRMTSSRAGEYAWENSSFSYSDAMAYYAMIRTRRPRTIVEIGGGWHTSVAQMACARNGWGASSASSPLRGSFWTALEGIEVVRRRVQDVETGFFNGLLRDGDMLFINSRIPCSMTGIACISICGFCRGWRRR